MANPANSLVQNLLPVQAYFSVDGVFQTFIGQGQPFTATINPVQSGLTITSSTIDSTTIGATTPSTGVFTNIATTTGTITTLASSANDIVNYLALQSYAVGISWKAPVTAATTVNITLSGTQTVDTVALVVGNTVLVKNQTNSAQNGIYTVNAGAWTYATGCTTWSQYVSALVFVEYGGLAGTAWYCTAQPGGTLGTTAMSWSNFSTAANYTAGTGLTLTGYQFSITPVGTAATYGSASAVPVFVTNASGQVTSVTNTNIAIAGNQITSGTIDTARLSGSYTGITGVGTLTAGTWTASTIGVAYGGTGANTLTGYVKGAGTVALTASATIPTTDLSGTISNAQLANSTISGVSLGSNLFSLTIGSGLSGTSYNGSSAVTITNSSPMTYPASGIPSSTGSAWNSSYSTTGSGSVLALATGATLNSPIVSDYETFTAASAPTYTSGRLWYDSTLNALSYNNDVTNNTLHIGQETQLKVYNNTGSTIAKGAPVYITSTTSGFTYPLIALAKADAQTTGNAIGLTNEAIATGSAGYVVINGILNGVNTSSFTVGDILYVSPYSAGQLMNTYPPTAYAVKIGVVAYANASGSIYVNQSNAYVVSNGIIGQVAIANGGTNGTATPTAGGVAYGSGTAYAFTSAGTSGQVLTSNGASAPTWSTPSTLTISDDTTTNATRYLTFTSATSGTISTENVSSTKLTFNPSTGNLTTPVATHNTLTSAVSTALTIQSAGTNALTIDTSQNATFNSTGAVTLTSGTTAQRPASPAVGMIRYNTTESKYEVYFSTGWAYLGSTLYPYNIDYLVVAGGGGAGDGIAGAGGAGGYRTLTSQSLTPGTSYTVTVGAGGAGGSGGGADGTTGSTSTFNSTSSAGGGGGGGAVTPGKNGGSGGGAGGAATAPNTGGTGNTPSVSPSQGNNGGIGAAGTSAGGGNGGAGTASSITGSSVTYAGGGGGGGGNSGAGGAGGSGVVILAIPTANYSGTTTGSPTVTTSGSNTILKFTGSGSYTA